MQFTGQENHSIDLDDAAKMTANYRNAHEPGALLGGYFSLEGIKKILDQSNCVGIRIYNALSDDGDEHFVLVGVKSDGEDLHGGEIAEIEYQCPPYCPTASPLNGTA
ncbi:MAG: hypothetical protein A2W25_14385 [candidate division Zixibacteria bacterium RBG_16_53_22]|nr:MAG: hypothetical protein A2W25_14385 [candidate division Zixibacteria bacterium RBG_16_53_22]